LNLKQNCGGGEWCIGSDFNAKENKVVRLADMKRRYYLNSLLMRKKFKWVIAERKSMNKLDRFLLSKGFIVKKRSNQFKHKEIKSVP
jgi:hypothetical protein